MPLSFKPFSQIDASDLIRLQSSAVPEGLRIDYKRDLYAAGEGREFLKDLSSFANSQGGYILIGADEADGTIESLPGVDGTITDVGIQRMENWCRDGLEPRVASVHMRPIDVGNGRSVIAISIPRSMNPPHRVSMQGSNRFFIRNSNGKHEASVEELRHLFGFGARLSDEIASFINDRRARIRDQTDHLADLGNGRLTIHIVNASSFRDQTFVDLKKLYADPYRFSPSSDATKRRVVLEGVVVGSKSEGKFDCRCLIARDGTIETVFSDLLRDRDGGLLIPGQWLVEQLLGTVKNCLDGLIDLGATGPFVIAARLETSPGAAIAFVRRPWNGHPSFDRAIVDLPTLTLLEYDPSTSTPHLIRPLLDQLWNSVGFTECQYFNGEDWNPQK